MKWFEREQMRAVWRNVRATVLDAETIRLLFTRNFLLKLLSLAIAFSLWFFVNFGERDTEATLKVPLELRNIPAHLMIISPRVDFIDLRVVGPRTLLGRIDRNRLAFALDMGGVRPGPAVFRIDADTLPLPRGVRVARINPAQISLELERVAHKVVPVHLRLVGQLPADLQVADTKVAPETVQVTGPASDVEDVQAANTEPLDIRAATAGTIERELALDPASDYLSFSANRVAVQVRLEEVAVTREFKHARVEVRDSDTAYHLTPESVRITVHGPKRVVSRLELDSGAVYIDAQGLGPGTHVMKPSIELPTGVDLLSVEPQTVQFVVRRPKRTSRRRG